jgi:hypothetical protein
MLEFVEDGGGILCIFEGLEVFFIENQTADQAKQELYKAGIEQQETSIKGSVQSLLLRIIAEQLYSISSLEVVGNSIKKEVELREYHISIWVASLGCTSDSGFEHSVIAGSLE